MSTSAGGRAVTRASGLAAGAATPSDACSARRWLVALALAWCFISCGESPVVPEVRAPVTPTLRARPERPAARDERTLPADVGPAEALVRPSAPPSPDYEQADLDADNDLMVGPPPPIEGCEERLERAGISFRRTELPLKKEIMPARNGRTEVVSCGAEQVIVYRGGPAKIRYGRAPTLTCRMALALARFEELAQREATEHLGQRIVRFEHLGTYSCRKMVRFDFVSEHSYANAIDIAAVVLENGVRLSVKKNFGALDAPPATSAARFLRSLARRAFDERLFSTVLTPYWDRLHADHLHLDLARYRVDGTRSF